MEDEHVTPLRLGGGIGGSHSLEIQQESATTAEIGPRPGGVF